MFGDVAADFGVHAMDASYNHLPFGKTIQRPCYEATRVSNQNFNSGTRTLKKFYNKLYTSNIHTKLYVCVLQFDKIRTWNLFAPISKLVLKNCIGKTSPYIFPVDISPNSLAILGTS